LALSVPLSRFTSRVGGGSAFYVRPLEHAMLMRTFLPTLIAAVSISSMTLIAQTNAPTKGTLVLGILTIESSYAQNKEQPSKGVPDTVQFWIASDKAWRIRTYATDHDIHPYSMGDLGKQPTEFATDHIKKHYSDVLASTLVLEFSDISDTNAVRQVLAQHNLKGSLEVAKVGFAFWNPDDGHYKSQTSPK